MEEEQILLHHWSHEEHPLALMEAPPGKSCDGCERYFTRGEQAVYGCSKNCEDGVFLHEECAEMPRRITRHPTHPQHTLIQRESWHYSSSLCAVCKEGIYGFDYACSSCDFGIHLRCAASTGATYVADHQGKEEEEEEERGIEHPSHPTHELRLLRRRLSFKCDACGTTEKGINSSSYICSICQYWIHERCAFLPTTAQHPHPLSLAFGLPIRYIEFNYTCDICGKAFPIKNWVYHCELCSYVVHIKCAINPPPPPTTSNANAAEDEHIIRLPTSDHEELIRRFLVREGGEMVIPHDNEIIKSKYRSKNHHHKLSLISTSDDQEEEEEEDDGDDDLDYRRSKLICDGCAKPIYQKKQDSSPSSSSSSSSHKHNYYMSCGECKYFLHAACFNLPPELPSLPIHDEHNHKLILKTCSKLEFMGTRCSVCRLPTNGLFYACTECNFEADIICASLPSTITHAAHPHHNLKLVPRESYRALCRACGYLIYGDVFFRCDSCELSVHCGCVLLPATNKHRWDKHPLRLTYYASLNRPGEFHCDFCEEETDPKRWMYHCQECEQFFHPDCIPTTSGDYRNIKFGQQYAITTCHPHHPLTYRLITTKPRCDLCPMRVHAAPGFQCAICNFVMCALWCGREHRNAIQLIH